MEPLHLPDDGDAPLPEEHRPLSELTTLEVGGPARYVFTVLGPADVRHALQFARDEGLPHLVLGGGSNLLAADRGFPGVVLQMADYRLEVEEGEDDAVILTAGAGVPWDELVAFAVTEELAGIECLSGIPGTAGAAPIQNIGAYGQELSDTLLAVDALDVATHEIVRLSAEDCGLGYRSSHFKAAWRDRFVVLAIHLRLRARGAPTVRYPELARAVGSDRPSLADVRRTVLAIRRRKAMVLDPRSPDRRSAGSFFVNPVVPPAQVEDLEATLGEDAASLPRYPQADGRVKLSAAWLIERAGFERGFALGRAGLSSRHTLALINRGAARAEDLIALAALIRRSVHGRFGIILQPEPVFVGFDDGLDRLLPLPGVHALALTPPQEHP